jgi:hypothetical protein
MLARRQTTRPAAEFNGGIVTSAPSRFLLQKREGRINHFHDRWLQTK